MVAVEGVHVVQQVQVEEVQVDLQVVQVVQEQLILAVAVAVEVLELVVQVDQV